MKTIIYILLFVLYSFPLALSAQKVRVSGGAGVPYEYKEDLAGTGVEAVYLFNTLSGATLSFTSSLPSVKIYRYTNSTADRELVPASDISEMQGVQGTVYTVSNLIDGRGYYIDANSIRAQWVIDYNAHQSRLNSITPIEADDKCSLLKLLIDKDDDLSFYTSNGVKRTILCKYIVSYNTMEWKDDKFTETLITIGEKVIGTELVINAPLSDTHFMLHGNQFARHFQIDNPIQSGLYEAVSAEAHITTQQDGDSNQDSGLGGSAPLTIRFYGHGNEPVSRFYTWNIYNVKDLENPVMRYTDKDIQYTFDKTGDYKVLLEVADRTSYCADTVSVSFKITESFLDAPNFFIPGNSSGVNNEFKVVYKSLIRFKCTIFNRWGVKLYEWKDPSKGWDGKHNGSYVNPGAYYYVIEAEGADGIKYKKGGDINILHGN